MLSLLIALLKSLQQKWAPREGPKHKKKGWLVVFFSTQNLAPRDLQKGRGRGIHFFVGREREVWVR
jgi:hypothetical protein